MPCGATRPADSRTLRLAYDYAPSTFDERGTAVPFTTPELAFSRGRSIYVFPWEGLTSVLRLTLHDRALQAEISLADAITPMRMRFAALRVAKTRTGEVDYEIVSRTEAIKARTAAL